MSRSRARRPEPYALRILGTAGRLATALVLVAASFACGAGERAGASAARDAELIAAAERGDAARVRELLARGASVDARDSRGRTALTAAAYVNRVAVARVLIRAGADVNVKDATNQSPFLIATSEVGDDPALLQLTLAARADVDETDGYNGTGLIRAAHRGYPRIVRRLLLTGMDVDHVNQLGWTALLEAIILGDGGRPHIGTVQALIDGGADVDLPDAGGVTPLAHAESRGQDEIARILRRAGARRSAHR